jgi:alcohol dehydrogenase YqhD (iron-dependent ADH family)
MRKQYYFRSSSRGLLSWDVDRLVQLTSHLPRKRISLGEIRELDDDWSGDHERPTWRAMVDHMKLIEDADLTFPIILSAGGAVMDGMHRVAKAALQGRDTIDAVQFAEDPEPDHVGLGPDELPY